MYGFLGVKNHWAIAVATKLWECWFQKWSL